MYVVLIALLYVLLMMVLTADSLFKAIMILLFGGASTALVFYLLDTPRRLHSRRAADEANEADAREDE
jgi:hypothetical protein